MDRKTQIEKLYIDALNNDEAPNVFADRILFLFGVVVTFCRCKEKTKAYIDYSIDKKVCSKCREVIKA
jgi:hypothetical protein